MSLNRALKLVCWAAVPCSTLVVRNRLLNFRHTRTATLEITAPDASAVLAGLGRGWSFTPVTDDESVDNGVDGEGLASGRGAKPRLHRSRVGIPKTWSVGQA